MDKKQMHRRVFLAETDYIPLAVNVKAPPQPFEAYDAMRDPDKAIANAVNTYSLTKQVGSDVIPMIESNFMECLIPSIFGAEVHVAPGGFIDVRPFIKDIYETEKLHITDIYRGEMENAIRHLEYIKQNAPDWLYVNPTRPMSPLDFAVVMRGGNFYMELAMEPELAAEFMGEIADVTMQTIDVFKDVIGQPKDECATVRGYIFPGIRLTGDAIVNLSPAMIQEVMCPLYQRFTDQYSHVMLHYCCLPAPSGHVIGALNKGEGVAWVDNWQGYKTLFNGDVLQKQMGICTDVKKEQILSGELLEDPFFTLQGRPLTASVSVDTVDEGKRVYAAWREMWEKQGRTPATTAQ